MSSTGSAHGLSCPKCGDPCVAPTTHLATQKNTSTLLTPDSPCKNYAEVNKWGRRWRVIEAYNGSSVRFFVDDMGPEEKFSVNIFAIPSMGDYPHDWNTFGECMDIALYKHDPTTKKYERKRVPSATGAQWAEEMERQNDFVDKWVHGRSTHGPAIRVQRMKDWVK